MNYENLSLDELEALAADLYDQESSISQQRKAVAKVLFKQRKIAKAREKFEGAKAEMDELKPPSILDRIKEAWANRQ